MVDSRQALFYICILVMLSLNNSAPLTLRNPLQLINKEVLCH